MQLWWILLIVSVSVLLVVLVRSKFSRQWLGYFTLNFAIAAFMLYFINLLGVRIGLEIPINFATITTIGVLGIPGMLLLVALKVTLF